MKKLATLAGAIPFAHLLGIKAGRAESDEDKDDEDDKNDKDASAEDEEKDPDARADDDNDGDDSDDKDKKDSKAKKSAVADEDKDDEDDKNDEKASAAVLRERQRCARIVAHGILTGTVRQACSYAFDTSMSAEVAIATIDSTTADRKAAGSLLAARMEQEAGPVVRPEREQPPAGSAEAAAKAIIAAASKAGVVRKAT